MDRRKFIKNTASIISLPLLLGGQSINVFAKETSPGGINGNGKVLVLIQLDGGNDGLNTLIPLDQYGNLVKARPEVILPEKKIIKLTDLQGIHPSMAEVQELYAQEKAMFIQNVGYPNPNLSHFRSKEIVLSASDSETVLPSGWFGRYLETLHPTYPEDYPNSSSPHPIAISIGSRTSPTCQGEVPNFSVVVPNTNTSYESQSGGTIFPDTPYGYELQYITQVMESTEKYLGTIRDASDKALNLSTLYPEQGDNKLADKLKIVARLIAGGLDTPIYVVNLGGFDTHANQVVAGETETGKHAALLKYVSEAVYAFQDDLKQLDIEERVISLAYSEFGRRIKSNKSDGTDHGESYPMMLFGCAINPIVYGNNPLIPNEVEGKDNVPYDIDFRRVYSSILHYWFELKSQDIENILFNDFELIPILKSNVYSDTYFENFELKILPISPNPITSSANIFFSSPGGKVTISLMAYSGQIIRVFLDKEVPEGSQSIIISNSGISKGYYLLVLQNFEKTATQKVVFI